MCKECWVGQHPILWRRGDEACSKIYVCMCARKKKKSETVERWRKRVSTKWLQWVSNNTTVPNIFDLWLCTSVLLFYLVPKGLKPKYITDLLWTLQTSQVAGTGLRTVRVKTKQQRSVSMHHISGTLRSALSCFTLVLTTLRGFKLRLKPFYLPLPLG